MAFDYSSSPSSAEWASQLDGIFARCVGAYAEITLRGYRRDLEIFAAWCSETHVQFLPASPETVAAFIDAQAIKYAHATIQRRKTAIRFVHIMADLPSPLQSSDVYLALRRAGRARPRRPKQVLGLTFDFLEKMLAACPDTLGGRRDAALLSVGYDTLCRSIELAWMGVEHFDFADGTVYIPRAKNDPYGDGRYARLSETSLQNLSQWLEGSRIAEGPVFRGLHTGKVGEGHLETSSIRRIIKAAARRAGLVDEAVHLSGHSMRVGGAQDLMRAGHDTIAIMTAGGWKNVEVVARYVERAALARLRPTRSSLANIAGLQP